MKSIPRRQFIQQSTAAGLAFGASLTSLQSFASAKVNKVRIGIIGVGLRGQNHLEMMLNRTDVDVIAMADPNPIMMATAQQEITKSGKKAAIEYGKGNLDYQNLLKRDDIDAVIIATPWEWHAVQVIDTLKAGKIPGVEVCGAIKLQDCWDMVNASEKANIPVMVLENVCYRRDILAVYNMVRKDLFG